MRWLRVLVYLWAFPTTAVGLIFVIVALLTRGRVRCVSGVLEVTGGVVSWLLTHATLLEGGAMAMTLGHVVLGQNETALDISRDHERVHVRQVERWGPAFLPAYLLCSLWLWFRGRDPYRDNPFEVEAYSLTDLHDQRRPR